MTELIGRLRDEGGYTVLVIEHDMHVVEGISDRVIALDHGLKIAEGSFEQVATDPRVVEAYLGRQATASGMTALLRACETSTRTTGEIHILQELSLEVGEGRARVPARRERVREVDHAEDDPRDRSAAVGHRRASTART